MAEVNVAVVQMEPTLGDLETNLYSMAETVERICSSTPVCLRTMQREILRSSRPQHPLGRGAGCSANRPAALCARSPRKNRKRLRRN